MLRFFLCVLFTILLASCVTTNTVSNVANPIRDNTVKCDAGDGYACHVLSGSYARGRGVEEDHEKALALSIKACGLNQNEACMYAALFYSGIFEIPKDVDKSIFYHEKACSGGITRGCNSAAKLHMLRKDPTPEDIEKAQALYNTACLRGDEDGCKGKRLFDDVAAGRDTSRSLYESEFEYQCYEGDYESCKVQGDRYLKGKDTRENLPKAAFFFDRACLGGNVGEACHKLGLMLLPTRKNKGDQNKSLAYLNAGCEANYDKSCLVLSNIYYIGHGGVASDVEKAEYYKKKHCEASLESRLSIKEC
ncbi:sel1 repeat family protein [Sneathiella marina]|uniref:Sel1 repeat family protein n=1 Tax=Sneathiella marina TaxID=2950108 RepID=A0ABY4W1F6_9PROT|nr:tetratricopeptide repeat protein [Sneathiella marina]USG59918.1 sel1 repeat family protein [Sneathiella marina]